MSDTTQIQLYLLIKYYLSGGRNTRTVKTHHAVPLMKYGRNNRPISLSTASQTFWNMRIRRYFWTWQSQCCVCTKSRNSHEKVIIYYEDILGSGQYSNYWKVSLLFVVFCFGYLLKVTSVSHYSIRRILVLRLHTLWSVMRQKGYSLYQPLQWHRHS